MSRIEQIEARLQAIETIIVTRLGAIEEHIKACGNCDAAQDAKHMVIETVKELDDVFRGQLGIGFEVKSVSRERRKQA